MMSKLFLVLALGLLIGVLLLRFPYETHPFPHRGAFPEVKVAALYESVVDQMRDSNEVARLLAELHAGFVHRGFFRWRGMAGIERWHDVYGILGDTIAAIKFVTISPTPEEVRARWLDEDRWRAKLAEVEEVYGPLPAIAFIDWAFTADTPLGVFSQELTPEQHKELDDYLGQFRFSW